MFARLSAAATYHVRVTFLLTLVFVAVAGVCATRVKIEAFPDVTNVQVMVIALVPGQAAEDVERRITLPLERALIGLPQAVMQRSITSFGLVQVMVTFSDDAEVERARQLVLERLIGVDLPEGVEVHLGPNDTPVGQIYQYTLEGEGFSAQELRSWQEWEVAKHLAMVPGVADVVSFGGFQKELHVAVDPMRLLAHGLTLQNVADVLGGREATSGGYLRQGEGEFVVRSRAVVTDAEDLGNTLVALVDDTPVLIRDVAHVVVASTPRRGTVARGVEHDSVEGIVLLRRGENPRQVLASLHQAVSHIGKDVLPVGMRIVPFYDRTRLVNTTLRTVAVNMLEGALLVTGIIWVFLRSWPFALAVALVMPLALLTAFVGLYLVGVPANLLSMGSIDFGILLDGAVVLVENIFRRLPRHALSRKEAQQSVVDAAWEVWRPTLFSMAIIVAAMLPIFTLERVEGRIFRPMALTYSFAVLGAMFATLTVVPALCAALLSRGQSLFEGDGPKFLSRLERRYQQTLLRCLQAPLKTVAAGFALVVMAGWWVPHLGSEFLPQMNEGDLHITVTLPTTMALSEGQRVLFDIRQDVMAFDEVADALTEQGHPEDGTDDEAPNQAKMIVALKPPETWPVKRSMDALTKALRQKLEARPGVAFNFSQPIKDRVEEAISGVRGQIVLKLVGHDLNGMQVTMQRIRQIIEQTSGARDVELYRAGSAQHVVADIDRRAAARVGLAPEVIHRTLAQAFGGEVVGTMLEDERQVDIRLKLDRSAEGGLLDVAQLRVPLPGGGSVPLGQVAHVHTHQGRTQINREQLSRFLALKCNIEGRDMGSFVAEAQQKVADGIVLPEGERLLWGGEFDNQRRAMRQLAIVVPITLALIFTLLWATFGATLPATVVLLGLPMACVGGVFALAMTHTTLSVSAAIGFITLLGVATLDGVLLVSNARAALQKAATNNRLSRREALSQAVSTRLRPVLMTALLASLGLMPAALSHAIGSDTQRPFARVIIGGLISATLLTLWVLPCLYSAIVDARDVYFARDTRT